jgi:hypothetical protein
MMEQREERRAGRRRKKEEGGKKEEEVVEMHTPRCFREIKTARRRRRIFSFYFD